MDRKTAHSSATRVLVFYQEVLLALGKVYYPEGKMSKAALTISLLAKILL